MNVSSAGLSKLMRREGTERKAYRDTKGIWTIGTGHTGPEVHEGLIWTDKQCAEALMADIRWVQDTINQWVHVPLTQNQFDALVSFIFNIGKSGFINSTCLTLLNERLYDMVPMAMLMWNKPPEIVGRRKSEAEQFNG